MKNRIRTSKDMATIASHTLAGRVDQAFIEMIANNLIEGINRLTLLEELAQSLTGSALANRRD